MNTLRENLDSLELLLEDVAFNPEQFLAKARSVMALVRRGATPGERDAGKLAMERLMDRAQREITRMREPDSGVTRDQISRFLKALQQIKADNEPEKPKTTPPPPRKSVPLFKVGQWVVHTDDNSVGKIIEGYRRRWRETGQSEFYYVVQMADGGKDHIDEMFLRRATQEEVDAATSQRPSAPKFNDDDWVVHTDDNSIGRIVAGGTGWDRSTQSRWYQVKFINGNSDLIEERLLRAATPEEVEAILKPKAKTGSNAKAINEVLVFARYVNPAEHSNKVYGVVKRNGRYYTFWGGMNKALATKRFDTYDEAMTQFHSKINKGYKQTPEFVTASHVKKWVDDALNIRFSKLGESRRYRLAA